MIIIPLTQGQVSLVCDCCYEKVKCYKWYAKFSESTNSFYATTNIGKYPNRKTLRMHRLILPTDSRLDIDHKDMNTLNNQCNNLRVASRSQNRSNTKIQSNNTTGYKGVYYHKKNDRWCAQIKVMGKFIYLGSFPSKEEAAAAYDLAAIQYFKEFARLNFPTKNRETHYNVKQL